MRLPQRPGRYPSIRAVPPDRPSWDVIAAGATGTGGGTHRPHRSIGPLLTVPLPRRMLSIAALTVAALTAAGTTGVALGATPSPLWPRGVDVASWQHPGGGPIDWNAAHASGVSFVVIKATEGTNYANPYFTADRTAATRAGMVVGAYHYARPARPISTAVDQARHFIAVTGLTRTAGHLAPALDLEDNGGLDPATLAAWTRAFLEEVESETGRTPILYTYRSFWTDRMADSHDFAKYPIWFAIYNNQATPGPPPGGWPNWALWQYTSSGIVPGIAGAVDENVLCCTAATLRTQADGTLSEIQKWHAAAGLVALALGAPIGVENPAGGGGRWQQYANGLAFWSVSTGVQALWGPIPSKYLALGGSNSFLRRPVSDIENTTVPGGQQARFQGGWIYWHADTGAHEVHGQILQTYLKLGGSGSALGLPTTDEYSVPGGRQSTFQHGRLRWDAAKNQVTQLPPGP
ncbi:Lysozyme M1 (1,4-beta-N-acetylmuramidase) [Frankia canadensis]|uniref:Lysozyme M1 (1,4-beta-N-acetylmuramidase) n=1 Tax=Frankia canadensis TaxID=1836972 RepID=A0A2I2KZ92_9ACTN|nr:GH25 family lysozyme [Frankia canadensis]SNQ50978.1 Lysozyme M1 (1,4-beta-N-acetylmuramidase) [Frankia canadensis]SOU58268.1 Lysozyme M1 (1,4-beta-N-acetylmuramidase) [Frankia canadensis]